MNEGRLRSRCREVCGRFLAGILRDIADHDRRTGICERRGDGGTDPSRAARDERCSTGQTEIIQPETLQKASWEFISYRRRFDGCPSFLAQVTK
jgi:hypothetical protein